MNYFLCIMNIHPTARKGKPEANLFRGFSPAVLSHSFMCHRMDSLNARAFLEKLMTHVLILREMSNGLWGDSV